MLEAADAHLGLVYAVFSALLNGTWGLFTKTEKARGISSLVLNYWIAEGVALSGLLLLAVPPRVFSFYGLLSGALFVTSTGCAVSAISLIGLAVASGVWCGTAVLSGFLWGVLVVGDHVQHMGEAAVAIAIILAGIAGIALAAWFGGSHGRDTGHEEGVGESADDCAEGGAGVEEGLLRTISAPTTPHGDAAAEWASRLPQSTRALLGLIAAVLAGAIGGLTLAPMLAAPKHERGLPFVPSQSLGALIIAPIFTAALTCLPRPHGVSFTQATSSRAAGPGMAAGLVWQGANICCILAVTNKHVGLAVATPIMQCGLFVAGAWGILLFKEIQGAWQLALYWISGATMVLGAALLAAAKGG